LFPKHAFTKVWGKNKNGRVCDHFSQQQ